MTGEQEIEERKLQLPKQEAQGRDMMVTECEVEGLALTGTGAHAW